MNTFHIQRLTAQQFMTGNNWRSKKQGWVHLKENSKNCCWTTAAKGLGVSESL